MHKLLIFYSLFHHNLMTFFCFWECIILRISGSVIGIISMLGKLPGNESFTIVIASPFTICWIFHFSVIVVKKLLKALATSVGSFNFSSFTSKVWIHSNECTFPASFFIMVHVVFILLLDFAINVLQCWYLASFITFIRTVQYLI